jgi:hypothetical protein
MVRKLTKHRGCLYLNIPKALADNWGLVVGMEMTLVVGPQIIELTPVYFSTIPTS